MSAIVCVGPGPHAPADGILGEVPDEQPVPRAMCAPCGVAIPLPPPGEVVPVPDITALAEELTAQRARLDAAEDALDHLIVASLDANPGSL